MPAPLLVGAIPAEAQNLKMAQVDVQIGRDRDRRRGDQGTTVGVGPGGVTGSTSCGRISFSISAAVHQVSNFYGTHSRARRAQS